uniref:Uncharacterized protein n=1 Tax=Phlebotomus papatasi TaxID=29031 RepID=A0A1B0DR57_PHLPP
MEENLSELCNKHLPKWLQDRDRTIFTQFIEIRPNINFIAVILVSGQYYEVWDREILRECSLERNAGGFSASEGVSMDIFFSYEEENARRVFYLIRIGGKLFVVERLRSSLSVRMIEENILSVEIEDKSEEGNPTVLITKKDGSFRETNFSEKELEDAEDEIEPSIFLLNYLESHKRRLESGQEVRRQVIREELHKIQHVAKYGPQEMHDGAPDEAAPLVKYGEVWAKFHNDRIVFGIPIFNTTYTR